MNNKYLQCQIVNSALEGTKGDRYGGALLYKWWSARASDKWHLSGDKARDRAARGRTHGGRTQVGRLEGARLVPGGVCPGQVVGGHRPIPWGPAL